MKILETRVMRGPNYWSIRRHKLIVLRLDLEELENSPTDKIPGFAERLEKEIPTLYEHHCSEGHAGGFLERVREGTWMGHVVEHVALELQTLGGMDTGFGRTRSTSHAGVYHVVYSYIEEKCGIYAGEAAVRLCQALVSNVPYDLAADIQKLREMREEERLGPSTGSLVEEAAKRGIPYIRLNKHSLVQLGYGHNQRRIQATVASTTSNIGVEIAGDKEDTKNLLQLMNIPTPRGMTVYDEDDVKACLDRIGYPFVLKPVHGNHGRGATINITGWDQAVEALGRAKKISRGVIMEQMAQGYDYRLLVINYRFVAAAKRTPAAVMGNGKSTIQELIDKVNTDPRRGYGHEKTLTSIKVDDMTMDILTEKKLTLESVLPLGEELHLKTTANLSTGGTSSDVTDIVHPDNVFMAERIARVIGLDICGIDIMSPDISVPLNENRGFVLEVNAAPGFRMHLDPSEGIARNVAEPVIDMLYPPGTDSRIPIIAITGTNGKTTTTRLTAHIMRSLGYKVGFTTTDGIYIQNRMLEKGDCTGPKSAEFVLMDPTVDFAVLECARGGILRSGLGFKNCNVGVVTNVTEDHLGLKDIDTLEDLAKVKGIVPESVLIDGWAILNADDDNVYNMRKGLKCNIALFSMDENNPRIIEHARNNGLSAVAENGYVTLMKGTWKLRIEKIVTIPLTHSGRAVFMIWNILPSILAAYTQGAKIEDLRNGLLSFIPSPQTTPGRMNIFKFKNFEMMVDYAHNPAGMRAIQKYLEKTPGSPKVGVIAATGDRRDNDIIELGRIAAEMFDEIVIRQDKHLRGRTDTEIMELLDKGIKEVNPKLPVKKINPEKEAIKYVIENAKPGSHITVCSDVITEALELIMKYKEKEDMG